MAEFKDRLKELRKNYEMSQDDLARKLHMSRSTIGNYEQGTRKPDMEQLEELADFFNVDLDYLTGKQDYIYAFPIKNIKSIKIPPDCNQSYYDLLTQQMDDMDTRTLTRLMAYAAKLLEKRDI